jgi:hypothetical protein
MQLGIKHPIFLSSREFPQESTQRTKSVIKQSFENYNQPSLEVTKIHIGLQEMAEPVNYDKCKAKKKFKVKDVQSKSPSLLPKSDMNVDEEDFNNSLKMEKNPIYDKADDQSLHISFNTQLEEPHNQIKFMELKRFIFQLENIVEFSSDDASDVPTLNRMLEQCINLRLHLNLKNLSIKILRDVLKKCLQRVREELNLTGVDLKNVD